MKKIIKNTLILTSITVISGLLLGLVYDITKEPIAAARENTRQEAFHSVLPDASSFEEYEGYDAQKAGELLGENGYDSDEITETVVGKDDSGETVGYVVNVISHEGYAGDIEISVGIAADGTVRGIEMLSIGETAGLGMKADEADFKDQFKDQNVPEFSYSKTGATQEGEIDALSGATITTNAVTNGVNAGLCVFQLLSEGGIG